MKLSYSRIDTFKLCPYKYKLQYIDKLKTKFNLDPTNALVLGTAIHTGIEKNVLEAIKGYYSNYPSVTPLMVNEAIKLEIMIEKAKEILPKGEYELCLDDEDYIGYMDLLVKVDDVNYDLYDFKYSNNVDNYLNSGQLHLYKYYFEKLNPTKKIRKLNYVIVPKVKLKQDEYESIEEYRERLIKECEAQDIKIVPIEYNIQKVIDFLTDAKHCIECQEFNKNPNKLCYFCDFKKYCESNGSYDGNIIYPEKRRTIKMGQKVLILGESGTGKSASMRNFHSSEILLINVAAKQLPFKCKGGKFETINTDSYREIKKALANTDKSVIVIDDSQYLMANEFMRRATEKGFDKFTEIGQNYWELAQAINELPEDKIVYVMAHIDRDQNGNEKIKTIGKLLDEKITVEGMYTIVLKTVVQDGKYYFQTQNSGHDTCKSPIGLFDSFLIDNDLKAVDKAIRDYYDLEQPDIVDELDRIDRKRSQLVITDTVGETVVEEVVEEKPKRSRRTAEAEEEPKKTLAEKLADFQNKEPEAEEVTEVPTRRRRVAETEPVVEEQPEEETPVRRRRVRN